ncbi:ras gtpase-activating protein [Anaeramoeba flamelloides]|uniref:Ras gtpase-activating protein n=1 Tax=Anaeramoeba flamelloides TaxID=1746091 RepID=A0ABQ8XSZ6_9EUKA|nr:ras gtpase-activating protein [Anaeramoeba flamelloides]
MIHLPLPVRSLLFRVSFHPQIENLALNSNEDLNEVSPDQLLLRWINFQIKKSGNSLNITNYKEDFQDCIALSLLVSQLTNFPIIPILQETDLQNRSKIFCRLLQETGCQISIQPEHIYEKKEEMVITFLAKLFLWKPSFEKKGKIVRLENTLNKKEQTGLNLSESNLGMSSLSSFDDLLAKYRNSDNFLKKNQNKNKEENKLSKEPPKTVSINDLISKVNKTLSDSKNKFLTENQKINMKSNKQTDIEDRNKENEKKNENDKGKENEKEREKENEKEKEKEKEIKDENVNEKEKDNENENDQGGKKEKEKQKEKEKEKEKNEYKRIDLKKENKIILNFDKVEKAIIKQKKEQQIETKKQNVKDKMKKKVNKNDLLKDSEENLDDFQLGMIDENGNELDDEEKLRILKQRLKEEEENIENLKIEYQLEKKKSNELDKQLETSTEENATLLTFTNLSQRVMENIDFLKTKFIESVTEVLKSCKGEIKVKLIKLINEIKEIQLIDSKMINAKYSIQIFTKAFFGLLKTHKFPKFTKRAARVIKKNILNLNPYDEKIMKEMFVNIMTELERNETVNRNNTNTFQSIDALFEHFYFINVFRNSLIKKLFDLLFESKILRIETIDKISQNNLNEILKENMDNFVCGFIQFDKVIDGIYEFLKNVEINSPRRKSAKLVNESKKISLGKTIRFIIEKYSSKPEKIQLTKIYNQYKQSKYHDYSGIIDRNKEIIKDYLELDDIEYLSFAFDSDIINDSSELVSCGLFYVFESLGLTLPFLHMIISQEILKVKNISNLFESVNIRSKMILKYSRLYGIKYLQNTISKIIKEQIKSNLNFEVDENYLNQQTEDYSENLNNLKEYFYKYIEVIFQSTEILPHGFRMICTYLKEEIMYRFPDNVLPTIGSFIFLNFFCPAIREPENFELINNDNETFNLTEKDKRGLTLISIIINSLSKGRTFNNDHPYLQPLNNDITTAFKNRGEFLNEISSSSRINEHSLLIPRSKIEYPKRGIPINPMLAHTTLNPTIEETISFHTFASNLSNDLQGFLKKSNEQFFPNNCLNYVEQFQNKVQNFLFKFQKINEIIKSFDPLYEILNSQFIENEIQNDLNRINSNTNPKTKSKSKSNFTNNEKLPINKNLQSNENLIQKDKNYNPIEKKPLNNTSSIIKSQDPNVDMIKDDNVQKNNTLPNENSENKPKSGKPRRKFTFRKRVKKKSQDYSPYEISNTLFERWKSLWETKETKKDSIYYLIERNQINNNNKWEKIIIIIKQNLLALYPTAPENKLVVPFMLISLDKNSEITPINPSGSTIKKFSFRLSNPNDEIDILFYKKKKKQTQKWIQIIQRTMEVNYDL